MSAIPNWNWYKLFPCARSSSSLSQVQDGYYFGRFDWWASLIFRMNPQAWPPPCPPHVSHPLPYFQPWSCFSSCPKNNCVVLAPIHLSVSSPLTLAGWECTSPASPLSPSIPFHQSPTLPCHATCRKRSIPSHQLLALLAHIQRLICTSLAINRISWGPIAAMHLGAVPYPFQHTPALHLPLILPWLPLIWTGIVQCKFKVNKVQ